MFFQPSAFPQTHLQTPSNPQITTGLSTIQCQDSFCLDILVKILLRNQETLEQVKANAAKGKFPWDSTLSKAPFPPDHLLFPPSKPPS